MMRIETGSNITILNIGKAATQLAAAYIAIIEKEMSFTILPSVMLWGPPGVGKSQGVKQMAKKIEDASGKNVVITDIRLLLFNPIDLRGIPTSNVEKTLAVWLKPKIFDMDPSKDIVNILFLDEISAAPQSVQAAAYQLTLDRAIGEHRLPGNCIVIAAGNRVTDKSVAVKMPKALANRLCHIEIESDFSGWRDWAIDSDIHPKVIGFLMFRRDYLMQFDPGNEDLAFATPRSWEMVSNILNYVSADEKETYSLIAGCIGNGLAVEFRTWCEVFSKLPSIDDIFEGKCNNLPKETDVLYATIASMIAHAKKHCDRLDKIENSIEYAKRMPPDFTTMILKQYMAFEEDYKLKLLRMPSFSSWLSDQGSDFI